MLNDISKLVSLCKRRGFVFPSSEIYGGMSACYDYGPLGVLLRNHIKNLWWRAMVERPDVEGLDSAILMARRVWEASGHVENFTDPLVDCRSCKGRFRQDELDKGPQCPSCKSSDLTQPRAFNLMFQTFMGPVADDGSRVFLRPETAQGIYINFQNVMQTARQKLPFGIAQIGKAFRNEITARNFVFRMREFDQMEMQFFVNPKETNTWFEYWLEQRLNWYQSTLGITEGVEAVETPKTELAHYAQRAVDIKFCFPFGLEEIEGVHNRGEYDLSRHREYSGKDLSVFDQSTQQKVLPEIVETSAGVDRTFLAVLTAFFREDEIGGEPRTYFAFPIQLAPYEVSVFPLMKKPQLVEIADKILSQLRQDGAWVSLDTAGSIGKRYRRADEIGTPLCITVDYETLDDQTVTVRDRDTARQIRVPIDTLNRRTLRRIDADFRA